MRTEGPFSSTQVISYTVLRFEHCQSTYTPCVFHRTSIPYSIAQDNQTASLNLMNVMYLPNVGCFFVVYPVLGSRYLSLMFVSSHPTVHIHAVCSHFSPLAHHVLFLLLFSLLFLRSRTSSAVLSPSSAVLSPLLLFPYLFCCSLTSSVVLSPLLLFSHLFLCHSLTSCACQCLQSAGQQLLANTEVLKIIQQIRANPAVFKTCCNKRRLVTELNKFAVNNCELPMGWTARIDKSGRVSV